MQSEEKKVFTTLKMSQKSHKNHMPSKQSTEFISNLRLTTLPVAGKPELKQLSPRYQAS